MRVLIAALLMLLLMPAIQLTSSPIASAAEVSTSTVGYSFAITTPPGYSNWVWTLYLSSAETGTASVDFPTGTDVNVVINSGVTSEVVVPANDEMSGSNTGQISNKVIRITSTIPISVYGCSREFATSDCTNFIPISSWGNRYRPLSYPTTIGTLGDRITVLTGNDAATVTMKFKTAVTTASGTFAAGDEVSTVMAPNMVWTLEAINEDQGFTGSLITSTAPIGVIAGAECINGFGGACDTNVEMVPPESSWGKNFFLNNYKNDNNPGGSGVRILASQDTTTVTISGDETRTETLNAGEIFSAKLFQSNSAEKNLSISIVADKPILVGHYLIYGSYTSLGGSDSGDPALSYMPPFEQYLSQYTVVSAGGFVAQFINVIIPTAAISTLRLDGASVSASLFRRVATSSWSSAQITTSTGSHNLIADQPFGIEIYGVDFYDSYAYVGGANYSALSTVASLRLNANSATGTVGQQICIPVTVLDSSDAPVLGIRVDGATTGTNSGLSPSATTDSSGSADVCYIGNAAGTDTLTLSANGFSTSVSIVWSLALPAISYSPSLLSLAPSVAMPTLSPTYTGGTVASWSVSPSLPAGISMSTSTGVITGTPTSDTAVSTYTVSATNATGSATTTISLSVIPAVQPTISYSPSTINFILDTTISTMTPTTTGTFPSWSVSPTLPRGLSIDTQSGLITGTPVRTTAQGTYTVTAVNSAGSSTTTLTLAVIESIPDISFNITVFNFVKNTAISIISPINAGSPATSWTISPGLSAGLSFSSLTGQISGTPSASATATTYTVTGTNTAGSDSATVQITVSDDLLAPSITYATSSASLTVGTAMASISPTNTGGAVSSYAVSPSVPAGVNFSTSTGIFSGTPTVTSASTVYTVTATNATGNSTATVTLAIAAAAATAPGAPTIGTATATGSTTATVTYTAPASNGGATITTYTATSSPGSITGSVSQLTSGTISMTGLTAGTAYTFTVVATNSVGNSSPSAASNSITTTSGTTTGLVPTFSSVTTASTGFTVTVTNYNASYTWAVTVTSPATVIISSAGLITVAGLTGQGTQATVTVTTTRTGYTTQSASVTGSTTPPPPPPNYLYSLTPPTLTKDGSTYVCTVGTYEFVRAAVTKETPKISFFIYTLLINGARVSQVSSNGTLNSPYVAPSSMDFLGTASLSRAVFELGSRADILPAQCEVLAYQENAVGVSNTNIFSKATPGLSWPAILPMTATTKIGEQQLNATANVEGTYVYSVKPGSTLDIGKYVLTVTFTPKDINNYEVVTAKNTLRVLAASTSIRNIITIQPPQQVIQVRLSSGSLVADPEMILGGKASAGLAGYGIEKIAITGSSVTVWSVKGFSGKTSLELVQSGAGGIINIVQPLLVLPTQVTGLNVVINSFLSPTLSWNAVAGAQCYQITVGNQLVCTTTTNSCISNIPLGPKSALTITATGNDQVKVVSTITPVIKADVEAASVNFDTNSYELSAAARSELLRFAQRIRILGYTTLTVTGHTDNAQGVDNVKLSQERALAVQEVLQRLLPGISITVKGQSDSEPLVSNDTASGMTKNRRAEIRVVQG